MQWIRKIYTALFYPGKIALPGYAVNPSPVYTKAFPQQQLLQLIEQKNEGYRQLLQQALEFSGFFLAVKEEKETTSPATPGWNNGYMPGLDIVLLYTILSTSKPKRYLEIGSGTSTTVANKAKAEQQLAYSITCIDPSPRKEIAAIADQWLSTPLQQAPLALFEALEENDVLFFDGSHLVHANSDVQWFFMEVLPRLKKGVIVQLHDIYLPYDYPQTMCNRYYAEQYMLATALLTNPGKFELIAPAFYISEQESLQQILQPLWNQLPGVEQHGGSFWFRIAE